MLAVSPGVTLVTGPNGSGKTSLLEALYVALQGSSFRGSDGDILQRDAPWYRIDVQFDDDTARTVKFDPLRETGRKQFVIDGKTNYRLLPKYKYPVVLFEPDDLRLLSGSPVRRRQFIDTFISQLDPQYGAKLRRYERALKQRNALLKQQATGNALFAWDVTLSDYGAYIMARREEFIRRLDERLNGTYHSISHTNDAVNVAYSHVVGGDAQKLLAQLHAHAEKDRLLGFTSVGPHRHDVLFHFNGSPAISTASRGEVRSVVLALKFLEVEIIESLTGKKPVVLLDDVFSELDKARQNYLVNSLEHNQIIITSATHYANLKAEQVADLR
jgi:DNA replication and repair protein RecF